MEGALLATRLALSISSESDINFVNTRFWVDAELVNKYINNESKWLKVRVGNMIAEIRDASTPSQWYKVLRLTILLTTPRVAYLFLGFISPDCRWLTSGRFLWSPEDKWPLQGHIGQINKDDPEVIAPLLIGQVSIEGRSSTKLKNISNLRRVLRVTAWILRFISNLRICIRSKNSAELFLVGSLAVAESCG